MTKEKKEKAPWDQDLEAEAAYLEQHALEHTKDLPEMEWSQELQDALFARIMESVEKMEKKPETADESMEAELSFSENAVDNENVSAEKTSPDMDPSASEAFDLPNYTPTGDLSGKKKKRRRINWKMLTVLAACLVLVCVPKLGTIGEKVYTPEAVVEHKDGEVVIKINNEERIESEVEEEEIYQKIESELGILALRLGYKPSGMEEYYIEISKNLGEARIQYLYNAKLLTIYMSRNFVKADINVKSGGEVVTTVDSFNIRKDIDVFEIVDEEGQKAYLAELELENVSYIIDGSIDEEEFLKIIEGIFIKNT